MIYDLLYSLSLLVLIEKLASFNVVRVYCILKLKNIAPKILSFRIGTGSKTFRWWNICQKNNIEKHACIKSKKIREEVQRVSSIKKLKWQKGSLKKKFLWDTIKPLMTSKRRWSNISIRRKKTVGSNSKFFMIHSISEETIW